MQILSSLSPGLFWVLCGLVAVAILQPKRPTGIRNLLTVILGPIGLLRLVAMQQNDRRYCPACDERIRVGLNSCPHCGHESPDLIHAPGELNALDG